MELAYITDRHEFQVLRKPGIIELTCMNVGEDDNQISKDELVELAERFSEVGIKQIVVITNYGVDVHSQSLKKSFPLRLIKLQKVVSNW